MGGTVLDLAVKIATAASVVITIGKSVGFTASSRRVARLHAQAELYGVLPEGEGRPRLASFIDAQAVDLVTSLERRASRYRTRWRRITSRTYWTGVTAILAGGLGVNLKAPAPALWVAVFLAGCFAISVGLIGAAALLLRKIMVRYTPVATADGGGPDDAGGAASTQR